MASRPKGYGMTAELEKKKDAKYDQEQDRRIREWIRAVLGDDSVPVDASDAGKFRDDFKNGVALCRLINAIKPGSVKKINESKMAFKMMENIGNFLAAIEAMGVSKTDLFQTVDLYEGTNIPQVLSCLSAMERKARVALGFAGPQLSR